MKKITIELTQKLDTEYYVMPEPPTKLDKGILKLFEDMRIDLTALYRSEDPFTVSDQSAQIADDAEQSGL